MSAAERVLWVQGRFVREERARIPASHPLVTHGVGVFETLRLVAGRAPWLDRHLRRLTSACRELGIEPPQNDWARVLRELARRNRLHDGVARITVGDGLTLIVPRGLPRTLAREQREGIRLTTAVHRREAAHLKGASWLPLWLAEREAADREILLLGARGAVLETSRSNLFVVTERGLRTAPAPAVLPGIAREVVLERARALGVRIALRTPALRGHATWREVFVSNAVRGIRPVRAIDAISLPAPGPDSLTRALQKELQSQIGL